MKETILIFVFSISLFLTNYSLCQWQNDVRLTNDTANSITTMNGTKCLASSGNILHIVWSDSFNGNYKIHYKRSTDNGISWGADIWLSNNSTKSELVTIAVSGSVVHVVWQDSRDEPYPEIYYKRSTDEGISWGEDTRLTYNIGSSAVPSIAVMGSIVHVVWYDNRNVIYQMYYKRSTDNGVNWGADIRLTNYLAPSEHPSIAVSDSIVHIAWDDNRNAPNNIYNIYYKRSSDNGVSWGSDIRLTNNTTTSFTSFCPSIAVLGSVVHLGWTDSRTGRGEIYYKRSTDGGLNWSNDTRLTYSSPESWYSSIVASGTFVHLAYLTIINTEYYGLGYKRSTDGGLTWENNILLINNDSKATFPCVITSGPVVQLAWSDNRNGNWEIYYKRNPNGNPLGINQIGSEIPSSYSLSQNYPNPFNPVTNIHYEIPKNGFVKLVVFDILGREIQTLVNEKQNAGTYEVTFDGSNLSSGIYFYTLSVGDFKETKKFVLLK
jgi:hypothetical protein